MSRDLSRRPMIIFLVSRNQGPLGLLGFDLVPGQTPGAPSCGYIKPHSNLHLPHPPHSATQCLRQNQDTSTLSSTRSRAPSSTSPVKTRGPSSASTPTMDQTRRYDPQRSRTPPSLPVVYLISASLQWRFVNNGDGWTIQNLFNQKFLDVDVPNSFNNGERIVAIETNSPRKWDLRRDDQFDGWR
jgi:hypothetical protein